MYWNIEPSVLSGTIAIPPSKSHTIRAILIATLAEGDSIIKNPLLMGDGRSAIEVARALGAVIKEKDGNLHVRGAGPAPKEGSEHLYAGNSGTTTNLFTAAACLSGRKRIFDGDGSLRTRPVRPLLDALSGLGATYVIDSHAQKDIPFAITGPLIGGTTEVNGISSQFVSSLLFTTPLLSADTIINVVNIQEKPYIELTLWWLRKMGITFVAAQDLSRFVVTGNQRYTPFELEIPADFSSATFAAVGAAVTRSKVLLTGLDFSDPQGDKLVCEVLKSFGATVTHTSAGVAISAENQLRGCTVDLGSMPDALPAIAVLATAAEGTTHIVNVAHARIKETDRIRVMATELTKMGAIVQEREDGLIITGSPLVGAKVNGYDDHRVVMALTLAGLCASGRTTVDTVEAAAVTYPSFAEDFKALGAHIALGGS